VHFDLQSGRALSSHLADIMPALTDTSSDCRELAAM
jgi:hypothetical protein